MGLARRSSSYPNDAHVGVLALGLLDDTRDGDRGSVDPGHKEPLEDGPVEPGVGPSGEEAVELSCRNKKKRQTQTRDPRSTSCPMIRASFNPLPVRYEP